MKANLSEFRGDFAHGYTEDDIQSVLGQIGPALGLELVCVWEYEDEYGTGGHSDLAVVRPDGLYELPEGLWELLLGEPGAPDEIEASQELKPHSELYSVDYRCLDSAPCNLVAAA